MKPRITHGAANKRGLHLQNEEVPVPGRDHVHFTRISPWLRWVPIQDNAKAARPQQAGEVFLDQLGFRFSLGAVCTQPAEVVDHCSAPVLDAHDPGELDVGATELQDWALIEFHEANQLAWISALRATRRIRPVESSV